MLKKIIILAWVVYVLLIAGVFGLFYGIKQGYWGYVPPLDELQSPISRYASQILTSDGVAIGTWSRSENRVFVSYDSIAPCMFDALIATEDVRFNEHSGIDARAVARAVVKRGLLGREEAGGGSTITQQLAKQLYSASVATTMERLMQKPVEWVIAAEIERRYTKQEILTLYLNYFDFLYNAVGIKTAAQVYFSKLPKDLDVIEAATLVGMCKNPSYYNPVVRPERCRERRNVVLSQMEKAGFLSVAERDSLKEAPLTLKFRRVDHKDGLAPYLREHLRLVMTAKKPIRADYEKRYNKIYKEIDIENRFYLDSLAWENDPLYGWCNKNFKRDGSPYDIYVDGLRVYTTIDSRMQAYAEQAMRKHMSDLQKSFDREKRGKKNAPYPNSYTKSKVESLLNSAMRQSERWRVMRKAGATDEEIKEAFHQPVPMTVFAYGGEKDTTMTPLDSIRYYKGILRSGMLSIEPQTGHVKAYVGGVDYRYFQLDMAMSIAMHGRRQVGSTIKPLVYSMAMEDGYEPDDTICNIQRVYDDGVTTWIPRNSGSSRVGEQVTLKWGLSQSNNWITAELMYRTSPDGSRFVDLLHDYGILHKDIEPYISLCLGTPSISVAEMASAYTAFVNRGIRQAPILVERIEDSEGNVLAHFAPRMNEVISEGSSYKMLEMMQAVVDGGTGGRVRRYGITAPVAGKTGTTNDNADAWFMGCVPRLVTACWVGGEDPSIRFTSMTYGQGAAAALPIWAQYMKQIYADESLGYSQTEEFSISETYLEEQKMKQQNDSTGLMLQP